MSKCRIGEKHITNKGCAFIITDFYSAKDYEITFEGGNKKRGISYHQITSGEIKNKYQHSVFGIGYIGEGMYKKSINGKRTKVYQTWQNMLQRCYCHIYQKTHPSYIGCSVDERWHNLQVFGKWFDKNYKDEFAVDKDILFKGNKVYSPETCCLVPNEINALMKLNKSRRGTYYIGVQKVRDKFVNILKRSNITTFDTPEEAFQDYKEDKEKCIKVMADKWRPEITLETYKALINYKVEITD